MAEGIATGIATNVLTQLSSTALRKMAAALGVKKEVEGLRDTLTAIQDVLPHAENLQLRNNNLQLTDDKVRSWLRRIKDAAYDAEDVIDDFNTEALRKKFVMQDSFIQRVCHFFSCSKPITQRFEIAHRIKEVRENLKSIKDDRSLGLDSNFKVNYGFISEGRETHGYIPEGKVIGRDKEKEMIVNLLLSDSSSGNNLSVIPIQGMGGIGKTALAQLVYNDKKVVDSFGKDRMMWVCVSDEFDLRNITEKIIISGTNQECPNLNMHQLQVRLRQHLEGKKYLLVLDDIWNEEVNKWEELKDLLIECATGSKIIVTTRSETVGLIMGATDINRLSQLSEDDCWNLFKGRAFIEGQEDTNHDLVEIGKAITKKCAGVPLAAKTLGGLCYAQDQEHWEYVRDSDIWELPEKQNGNLQNDILRALKISYYYLPFSLQQCFAYCSIFPKDYKFEKDMLIKLWIAQEFIHSSGGNRSLEDIGNGYVKVLMWRSFFQEPEMDDYGNLKQFKMHDLVHDLAQFVAGVECFMICNDKEENCPERVRHLFVNTSKTLGVISKPSNIRTLMFESHTPISLDFIISNLKFLRLRVLVFKNDDIDHLSNSIDKLKHLRYLQIECRKIKSLPESITNLQNLQVLKIACKKFKKLPERIQNMINLKHIYISERYSLNRGKKFDELSHMPIGLKELKSLETLSHFVVGKDEVGCVLNGLNELRNLGGMLKIMNIENVKNAEECKETNLKDKKHLRELELRWEQVVDIKRKEEMIDFKVLENLEPPPTLKILKIWGYPHIKFPRWSMESSTSLRNVVEIEMMSCKSCQQLFPLSHLPFLKILNLRYMDNLKYIEDGPDLQSGKECFSSLTTLDIGSCPNLESWFSAVEPQQEEEVVISFPCLVQLNIWYCPKLKSLPLVASAGIKKLRFSKTTVVGVSNPTNSSSLFTSLEKLSIEECWGMESWPNWLVGSHLPSLRTLEIGCTPTLPFLPQEIQHLPALKELEISNYCEEALPEWMANFTSLGELRLGNCPNLKILPEWMANFTSLGRLHLENCPNLKILPEWVLRDNTTVTWLYISNCPHLKHRYNKETGEDRHKIAHIKNTHIFD